jgi:hypothetical protein
MDCNSIGNTSSVLQNILQLIDNHSLSWLRILFSTSEEESARHINTIYQSLVRKELNSHCLVDYDKLFEQTFTETTVSDL